MKRCADCESEGDSMDLWMQIKTIFDESKRQVKIFEAADDQGAKDLAVLGASPETAFGAIIANTSGIVVDNWISILGQTSTQRAGVADFNARMEADFGGMLVVAVDLVGGLFALNMGRFDEDKGLVWYFAPDTLSWESLESKYSEFIAWVAQGDIDGFYQTFRWDNWELDVWDVDGFNSGMLIYPYLWSRECSIETASKNVVPLKEIIGINLDFEKQFSS